MREWLRCETYAKCKYPRVYPMRSCHVPRPRLSWTSRVSRVPRRARPLYSLQPDYGSPQRLDTFYDSILRCHLFTYLELIHLYRNFCICLINEIVEIRSSLPIFIRTFYDSILRWLYDSPISKLPNNGTAEIWLDLHRIEMFSFYLYRNFCIDTV